MEGANAPNLTTIIEKHAKAPAAPVAKAPTEAPVDKEAALEKRLKALINTQPVMVILVSFSISPAPALDSDMLCGHSSS